MLNKLHTEIQRIKKEKKNNNEIARESQRDIIIDWQDVERQMVERPDDAFTS